jgi:hypothetical protein
MVKQTAATFVARLPSVGTEVTAAAAAAAAAAYKGRTALQAVSKGDNI